MIFVVTRAPISVIQPISSSGLAVLAVFSHYYLHEHMSPSEWAAVALSGLGIVIMGITAAEQAPTTSVSVPGTRTQPPRARPRASSLARFGLRPLRAVQRGASHSPSEPSRRTPPNSPQARSSSSARSAPSARTSGGAAASGSRASAGPTPRTSGRRRTRGASRRLRVRQALWRLICMLRAPRSVHPCPAAPGRRRPLILLVLGPLPPHPTPAAGAQAGCFYSLSATSCRIGFLLSVQNILYAPLGIGLSFALTCAGPASERDC